MPDSKRSRAALLQFLDYLAAKGLMNPTTARSRKAAAKAVLGDFQEDEVSDLATVDLDDAMARFQNLHGGEFTPGSLGTYKSRTKAAIEDFLRYQQNPLAFRASTPNNTRKSRKAAPKTEIEEPSSESSVAAGIQQAKPLPSDDLLPIPLRANLTVYVQGLPHDLTAPEGRKIANVILAMVLPTD